MLVIGHRGAPREAPENTLEGFSIAMSHGVHGVELDVRLSADGVVVVCHDPELTRLAGLALRVRAASYTTLLTADLGGGAKIPTLDAVLEYFHGRGLVNVEVKYDDVDPAALALAVARVLEHHPKTEVILSSFSHHILAALGAVAPRVPRGVLIPPARTPAAVQKLSEALTDPGARAVHPHWSDATNERVATWLSRGLEVNVWTVDDPKEARRLREAGASAVITNLPAEILRES